MGDRIVVLDKGVIQQIAPPMELYARPANLFVAGFIGSPAMNFVQGQIESAASGARFVSAVTEPIPLNGQAPDKASGEVTFGIRPEDVYVAATAPEAKRVSPLGTFTLDVLEPMGNEIVAYLSRGGTQIVARVEPQPMPEPGENVALGVDTGHAHLFRTADGARL